MKKVILIFVTIVLSGLLYAKIIRVPMRYFVRLMVSLKSSDLWSGKGGAYR